MELLVSTRNGVPVSRSRARKRSAPGSACSSWTSTPSMSISHERISRRVTPDRLRGDRAHDGGEDRAGLARRGPGVEADQEAAAPGGPAVADVVGEAASAAVRD